MKADFPFTGLKSKQKYSEKEVTEKAYSMDDALKTSDIIYLNAETWMLFVPPYQNIWLRAWQRASMNLQWGATPYVPYNMESLINKYICFYSLFTVKSRGLETKDNYLRTTAIY